MSVIVVYRNRRGTRTLTEFSDKKRKWLYAHYEPISGIIMTYVIDTLTHAERIIADQDLYRCY